MYKKYGALTGRARTTKACQLLQDDKAVALLHLTTGSSKITLQYLEGVAKIRFALNVVSELIYSKQAGGHRSLESLKLMEKTEAFCKRGVLNQEDGGPAVYLVKQLARQYGLSFINNISSDHELGWIVPDFLKRKEV